jgi:cell division protein ZapE
MGPDRADEARRFTLLVDVLYDQRVKLVVSAEAQAGDLLVRGHGPEDPQLKAMIFQFDRTASRLSEMQTREYLVQPRAGMEAGAAP